MAIEYYDILPQDDEQPTDVVRLLHERFGVAAQVSDDQYNGSLTVKVAGTADQHRRVRAWHNAPRTPRPDLRGKPPVAKGQRRTHDYEPGDEAHNMATDPDCRLCGETRRTCEGS